MNLAFPHKEPSIGRRLEIPDIAPFAVVSARSAVKQLHSEQSARGKVDRTNEPDNGLPIAAQFDPIAHRIVTVLRDTVHCAVSTL